MILNASPTARAGDYISLQGWNFGSAPSVWLDTSDGASSQLPILNKVGSNWLSVQVPTTASGGLSIRVRNNNTYSAAVAINGARAYHLDALQIVPSGAVRIFGRNLLMSGSIPVVKFDGQAASVNTGASNEHMLVVTAPSGLAATKASVITVDNGNGTGPSQLDRTIEVVTGAGGDPFALGVGWAASLTASASRVIDATSDSRLKTKVACNGSTDDTAAIAGAISLASSLGGGVVKLPFGTCRLANSIQLLSKVVIQGAGRVSTTLKYSGDYPMYGGSIDSAGIADLTLANNGAKEGLLLYKSNRVFLKNVRFNLGASHQMFLTDNQNFAIQACDFNQTGILAAQGPFIVSGSRGFVYQNSHALIASGSVAFDKTSDGYIFSNHFTRDGNFQNDPGVIHVFTMNFASRLAVLQNTFDVANGPIVSGHNDGETLLTEGGGNARTENLGTVQTATASTVTDKANTLDTDPLGTGALPENYGIAIVGGKGAGQTRRIKSYASKTITVDTPWDVVPDSTSRYATMVWGLEKSLIKGNTLSQNPRGIMLYQTGVREVDIIGNTMSENGGIYLRAYQSLDVKQFMPMYNVKIAKNKVTNTAGVLPAQMTMVFVNHDGKAFGIAGIGVDMQDNQVVANTPNVYSIVNDYAGAEGFVNRMNVEENFYETPSSPRVLGSILQRNTCSNCDVGFRLGTGANGTMLMNNVLSKTKTWWDNTRTSISSEIATDTIAK